LGLTAQRIYQDLVEQWGFSGSYDCVKRYAKKLRKKNPKWFDRLPTSPGREAQVDFGLAPCFVLKDGKYRRPYVFKMTLSHSRHAYEELVWRQDTETWIRCHEHAFHFFNGVTQTVKLDNLKAGVIKPDIYDPALNPVYAAYAIHAGFVALPCQPNQPNQKGRVEHDVGYTKSNGLAGKRFESIDDGNTALRCWNKRWASTRIHGTTRMQVRRMFYETERDALLPLPQSEFPMFETSIRKVDVTGCVAIKQNFYSVPYHYICKEVLVHFNKDMVKVLDKLTHKVLIVHKALQGKGKLSVQQHCKPPYANRPKEQQELYYCRKAAIIGKNCERLVERFLMTDEYRGILRVRGVLKLADSIDKAILDEACADALMLNIHSFQQIKSLCLSALSARSETTAPKLTQAHDCIRELDEYQNHFNRMVEPV
jgi:transposase